MQTIDKCLNYDQQAIIGQMIQKYQISNRNIKILFKYYNTFSRALNQVKSNRSFIKTLAQISLIFTQKSNFYQTIEGKYFPGICFSMNDILKSKSYSQIRNITSTSREVLSKVKLRQNILKLQVQKSIQQIQKGLKEAVLFEKLCLLFYRNTLQVSKQFETYKQKLISFSWHLYIDAKHNIMSKKQNFLTKKFLMISVLQTIVLNSLIHIRPLILQKSSPRKYNVGTSLHKKQLMSTILQILLQQAQIQNHQFLGYQIINEIFDSYFDNLISNSTIKSFSQNTFDFLCNRSLEINFRKVDRKINKELESNQIDLRKFIYYEISNEKDHKKTAIQDKLIIKHKKCQKNKNHSFHQSTRKYKSHRILNLDECDNYLNTSSVLNQTQINFPKNLIMQHTRMSIPFLHQSSEKDQLSRYILQKTRLYISKIQNLQPTVLKLIQDTFNNLNQSRQGNYILNTTKESILLVYQFYSFLAETSWVQQKVGRHNEYILEQTDSTHQCLLIIAIGTIILNQTNINVDDIISNIVSFHSPDLIDLFYAIIYVQGMVIPQKMGNYLGIFSKKLTNQYIWNDQVFIEQVMSVSSQFKASGIQTPQKQAISCILQRVTKYTIQMIQYFERRLSGKSFQGKQKTLGKWTKQSLILVLNLVVHSPEVMYRRCLDQIILCSMYGTSKKIKMPLKFHELIQIYQKFIGKSPIQFQRSILNVQNNLEDEYNFKDIIEFYNLQFISYLNFAYQIGEKRNNLGLIQELTNFVVQLDQQNDTQSMDTYPSKFIQKAIVLSPDFRKTKSPCQNSLQKYEEKQNVYENMNQLISIQVQNTFSENQGTYSYGFQQNVNKDLNQQKLFINLELNSSRNPTRIKQRKSIQQRSEELCVTQKAKHPIFVQFRDD